MMKIAYGIVGLIGAVAAFVAGVLGMPEVMVVTALLAAALLLAANADRIARVKASATGFEAETRAMIEEARATLAIRKPTLPKKPGSRVSNMPMTTSPTPQTHRMIFTGDPWRRGAR